MFYLQTGVKYSAEMEVFSLKSLLTFLENCGIKVQMIVTDRSRSVRSMLALEFAHIDHQFDVW